MPENQITREQEIISLHYHNGLTVCEIARKTLLTKKEVAEVLTGTTLKQQDDSHTNTYSVYVRKLNVLSIPDKLDESVKRCTLREALIYALERAGLC